jgi:hypothetical protein
MKVAVSCKAKNIQHQKEESSPCFAQRKALKESHMTARLDGENELAHME